MHQIIQELSNAWSFVLVQGLGGNLTIGKILMVLTLAFLGHILARKLSQRVSNFLERAFKFPVSTIATIRTFFFYFVYFVILFFVFRILEIPLTIFAVLGSAVAIGVGFGSQHIVRNFLSGVTVLIEQPIEVGHFLEVDGLYGQVESIGFRSTRIRTPQNTHVIVPNCSFLEGKVLNWTLSGNVIRGMVKVSVPQGSDLQKVHDVLSTLADGLEWVRTNPAPYFNFVEFGSSSLDFEYFFYAKAPSRTQLEKNESKIRFAIEQRFREESITIASPQLEVHVNSQSPELM